MEVSDKAATLRAQEHGHQPIVCHEADAFLIGQGSAAYGIGYVRGGVQH